MNGYSVALFLTTLIMVLVAAVLIPRLRRELHKFKAECADRKEADARFWIAINEREAETASSQK